MLADRQTDTQRDRQTDCNTALPYRGEVKYDKCTKRTKIALKVKVKCHKI